MTTTYEERTLEQSADEFITCPTCQGDTKVVRFLPEKNGPDRGHRLATEVPCPVCEGKGKLPKPR